MEIKLTCSALVIVAIITMATGCERANSLYEITTPTPEVVQIPKDWKNVETAHFVFSLPPEMKEKKVRGIDTELWQYDAPNISLSIEAGFLGGDFSFIRNRYESTVQSVLVNGLKADRIS